ncbi:MAG: hypothetical protein AAF492_30555, partial [Verrucomicrobiota bacterium]
DFDGDGVSNSEECRLGSDPTDPMDLPPRVGFRLKQTYVTEPIPSNSTTDVSIEIVLNPPGVGNVSVLVDVRRDTAEIGEDYALTLPVLQTFLPSETSKVFSVQVNSDQVHESAEYVEFALQWVSGPAVVGQDRHGMMISNAFLNADNDCMPDWWEELYFTNTLRTGTNDWDDDGLSDCYEFLHGMDPTKKFDPDTNDTLKLRVHTPLLD